MYTSVDQARLRQLLQRLKAVILRDLSPQERATIKQQLADLHQAYQDDQLTFDAYKIQSLSLLTRHWDACRTEQWLYRHNYRLLSHADIFTLVGLSQKLPD